MSGGSWANSLAAPNPWPGAGSLLGKLRHGWGKLLAGWGKWGGGTERRQLRCAARECRPGGRPPGSCRGWVGGSGGGTLPWGPRCLDRGSAAPGGHSSRSGQPWWPLALGFTGASPKRGVCRGAAWPRAGGLSLVPPPSQGCDPHRAGGPGRKRLPAGLHAGYKSGPESLSGMRWHPARFPRQPRCRKYTRSWWWLPQRWAGCHVAGGHSPAPRCAGKGPRHGVAGVPWGCGGSVGQWSWALVPIAGSHCPRLPLMCRSLRPR